ncbi:MAG: site-2 protease family protein [Chloroflexi bacterium]|nr:site-2 protease family protein [Chloroflexota bacterium]
MKYTIPFGTYFGIPVRIHLTFPLILVVFGAEAWLRAGWLEAFWAVLLVACVFVCVVLHEFGHSLQVRRYGIRVKDIILLPIGGMARAESIPEKPIQEIIVAISGPLVNFALALIFFIIIWLRRSSFDFENEFLGSLLWINLVLGVFNLTPAFPMDGGRILRAFFAMRLPYLKATRYAKNIGQLIAVLFVIVGFRNPRFIMLPVIAVFIFFGAISEERIVRVKVALKGRRSRDFLRRNVPMLRASETVEAVVGVIGTDDSAAWAVTDDTGEFIGAVVRKDLFAAIERGNSHEPVATYARSEFPRVDAEMPAIQTYYLMRADKIPLVGVVADGRYEGLVFFEDMAAAVAEFGRSAT